jgi:hypothetical protein
VGSVSEGTMKGVLLVVAALVLAGCSTLRFEQTNNGLTLGRSGWQLSGGADFEKKVWYVLFVKPWGGKEIEAAQAAQNITLPE